MELKVGGEVLEERLVFGREGVEERSEEVWEAGVLEETTDRA